MGKTGYYKYRDLLRERYMKIGLQGLFDREAIELLLGYAIPGRDVRPLAERLLKRYGDFQGVLDSPLGELSSIPGMDEGPAVLLKAARDCCDLYLKKKVVNRHLVRSGLELIKYCRMSMTGLQDEQFRVIFLNTQDEVIDIETVHEGTIDKSVVYPRKVLERAFYHKAAALVFVHNHPSGKPVPSASDRKITGVLATAAASVEIDVLDHIIIGKDDFFSFSDAGLLPASPAAPVSY